MNTKQKLRQIHLNEWAARFSDQKSSGLTVKQWCEQNNFTIHTYNYWKHALKEEVASQVLPDIVPVSLSEIQAQTLSLPASNSCLANRPIRATAKLTINDVSVEVDSDISEELSKLEKQINQAISDGVFSISNEGYLQSDTTERLKELGYKVTTNNHRNESYYSIAWK